jgi:hypothetical protein
LGATGEAELARASLRTFCKNNPEKTQIQTNGRIRKWAKIAGFTLSSGLPFLLQFVYEMRKASFI